MTMNLSVSSPELQTTLADASENTDISREIVMRILFFLMAVCGIAVAPAAKPKPPEAKPSVRENHSVRR